MVEEKKKKLSSELLNFKEDKYQDYHLLMNVKEDECSLEDAGKILYIGPLDWLFILN